MKKLILVLFAGTNILLSSCSKGQTDNTDLEAKAFSDKIKTLPAAPVIDVRTPEEFTKGHLQNAVNYNWNGDDFDKQIAALDKSKPVFVYCLSGGRSNAAADKMRADGFKEVYELNGGIMSWRAANLPEAAVNTATADYISRQQFEAFLKTEKLVLVDFYADWCAPCQKMKPYLDEIAEERKSELTVIRINADENPQLCKELGIEGLPVLMLYQNKVAIWQNTGYITKEDVLKNLK